MVRGNDRNLGGTGYTRKEGGRKAASGQNLLGGGRYGISEMVKEDTKQAFSKVQMLKLQGKARFPLKDGDYVELDPVKQGAMVSPQQ